MPTRQREDGFPKRLLLEKPPLPEERAQSESRRARTARLRGRTGRLTRGPATLRSPRRPADKGSSGRRTGPRRTAKKASGATDRPRAEAPRAAQRDIRVPPAGRQQHARRGGARSGGAGGTKGRGEPAPRGGAAATGWGAAGPAKPNGTGPGPARPSPALRRRFPPAP
ncbi:translation initiation factor IF-2-like [Gallus gallus]|uniref:translation initiation factor IF-2-like n=1 Tax=Gallus gallus TaxID=9031 RepID=UPI001AE47C3A|nr:translation initiation factor IF-2-like [Gallus gallus]